MTAEHLPNEPSPADDPPISEPAIDLRTLAQLEQLDPQGTNNIVQRVLQTYERSLIRFMEELGSALPAADHSSIARLAHTLRSSSASVGALQLSAHCKAVETMIREGRVQDLGPAVQALQNESVRVQAELAAMLANRGAVN